MDQDAFLFPTIVFEPPATSPDRRRRRHRHHRHITPLLFDGDWGTDSAADDSSPSSDGYSSSDDGRPGIYTYRRPRRHRHRHIYLPEGRTLGVPNALVRPPAAPRNYGYRRLHYQGGQERRGRQRTRSTHCHRTPARAGCIVRSPQRNILVRCGKWLFGDSGRCHCGRRECRRGCCAASTGHCGEGSSRSRSPTRHREEEYWGPGTQDWVYGPPGRNTNWRDTPWSSSSNSRLNAHNLAPGAVVEEVEEGGALPAVSEPTDRIHNHYHLGSNGRSRRSSQRRGLRDFVRDPGVLGLVNQERDREFDRNMVDRQTADRERDRAFDRDMMDREIAKQRDQHLLALLDRQRERELNGIMVNRGTTEQQGNRLLTLLDRDRDRDPGGKGIMALQDQNSERRRDSHPSNRSSGRSQIRSKARQVSSAESEDGLRAEMEALRNDFKNLMRNASRTQGAVEIKRARREHSAVSSVMSRSSGRQTPSADIRFTPGRTIDDGRSQDEEDSEAVDESTSSTRNVFGDVDTETAQVLQVPLSTDEASVSS